MSWFLLELLRAWVTLALEEAPEPTMTPLAPAGPITPLYAVDGRGVRAMSDVVDNSAAQRFELPLGGEPAVAYYRLDGDRIALTHTEVPKELSGQGIGSKLAEGVFEILRNRGSKVDARCPFMAAYASRHPEYAALLTD
jgi:predicted GNAT family acetyltransferase